MTSQVIDTPTMTAEHFESIYAEAAGDAQQIPWADGRPSPALVNWLNVVAPSLVRCGARVAVVGCGLGDDAREVMRRGYDVLAFDCSPTAIDWCRRIDPAHAAQYVVADLFDLPSRWRHRFDLVVEVNTMHSLAPDQHEPALAAISHLISPRGYLLVVCRGAGDPVAGDAGPPWALTEDELDQATAVAGLVVEGAIASFADDENPPVQRMRALMRRA